MTPTPSAPSRARRAARSTGIVLVAVTVAWLTSAGIAEAATGHTVVVAAGFTNPLDNIRPDFSLWGSSVGDTWRRLMAAFWAACLAVCSLWVIVAGAKWGSANRRGFAGQQVEAKQSFQDAATGLGACAGSSIIIGGVLYAVSG